MDKANTVSKTMLPFRYYKVTRIFSTVCKNGKDLIKHHWKITDSLPKMWVEGFEYKFNKTLLESEIIKQGN